MNNTELPQGFTMALAQNEKARNAFSAMSPEQQRSVLRRVHSVRSKQEMQQLVANMADGGM